MEAWGAGAGASVQAQPWAPEASRRAEDSSRQAAGLAEDEAKLMETWVSSWEKGSDAGTVACHGDPEDAL